MNTGFDYNTFLQAFADLSPVPRGRVPNTSTCTPKLIWRAAWVPLGALCFQPTEGRCWASVWAITNIARKQYSCQHCWP